MSNFLFAFLIFLIANTHSNALNVTLDCQVRSCDPKIKGCSIFCRLPDDLANDALTEVDEVKINDAKYPITELELAPMTVIQHLPGKIGAKFPNLEKFVVFHSDLEILQQTDFIAMELVKKLNLANNKIRHIPDGTLSSLASLQVLYLYENKITSLPHHVLYPLQNLREFHANNNGLERLEADFFKNNVKIEIISLYENKLKSLSENFTAFSRLEVVDLRDNFEHCGKCRIESNKTLETKFDGCKNERQEAMKESKQKFIKCANVKVSENDDLVKKLESLVQLQEVKLFGNFSGIERENAELLQIIHRIDAEVAKDSILKNLLSICNGTKEKDRTMYEDDYRSCMYCHDKTSDEAIKQCQIRYVRDYGDKLNEFVLDVKRFFRH